VGGFIRSGGKPGIPNNSLFSPLILGNALIKA